MMLARQTAYKIRIKDLFSGKFIKEVDQTNYILIEDKKISRINLMGTVVTEPIKNINYVQITIDDGSAKITVRNFENNEILNGLNIGDSVLLIGKPREWNNERYVVAEIIKKIKNLEWLKVRELELKKHPEIKQEKVAEEKIIKESPVENKTYHNILEIIRSNDKGDGVDFDKVLEIEPDSENTIKTLLERGELFEVKPGKLRILE